MGNKRSQAKMAAIETRLRSGMTKNGIRQQAQDEIVQSIVSFALYGFPESHAASFALLAYASAYLKCHYLAAFTAALLNNQPMGFYHPATIVKDAQRHGLRVRPVDVTRSYWPCTLECECGDEAPHNRPDCRISMRMGLRYVRGLREETALALVSERNRKIFFSVDNLARRVPELRRNELNMLAQIGALNGLGGPFSPSHQRFQADLGKGAGFSRADKSSEINSALAANEGIDFGAAKAVPFPNPKFHRRDALWQVEKAAWREGSLLADIAEPDSPSPLTQMTSEERLIADYHGTGLTVGAHPMLYRREEMNRMRVVRAIDLCRLKHGQFTRIAGCVIARQRPGTAHGFVFLSLEDETGVANAIITPDLFEKNRLLLVREPFLLIEGTLQHLDNVISVKAERLSPLNATKAETSSHDFH